jgi:hypothetical protein
MVLFPGVGCDRFRRNACLFNYTISPSNTNSILLLQFIFYHRQTQNAPLSDRRQLYGRPAWLGRSVRLSCVRLKRPFRRPSKTLVEEVVHHTTGRRRALPFPRPRPLNLARKTNDRPWRFTAPRTHYEYFFHSSSVCGPKSLGF